MTLTRRAFQLLAVVLIAPLFTSGCTATPSHHSRCCPSPTHVSISESEEPNPTAAIVQASFTKPTLTPGVPLSLPRLIEMAIANHPEIHAAEARSQAAFGELIQAGLYPNPTVGWEADDLGNDGHGAGKQGPMLAQEIVLGDKLELARAAAAHGVTAADWDIVTKRFEIITRVRSAYFEALTAQRGVQENEELERIAKEGLKTATRVREAGEGTKPDVLRAEVELNQTLISLAAARERAAAAWRSLSTAIGHPQLPSAPLEGSLEKALPTIEFDTAVGEMLARSSELRAAGAEVLKTQEEARRAVAERVSNVNVQIHPFYQFPSDDLQLMVALEASLPVFDRNQGNILAAQANIRRAAENARQVELQLIDRLTQAYQSYEDARYQVEIYEREIIPKAQESLSLVMIGYETGDAKFDYTTVLEAQRTLANARLAKLQAQGELWKALSEIEGLLQRDAAK